jgi:hypothetical protein
VAQQELLIALDSQRNASLVESAKRKLLLWGLTQEQVDDLVRDKKVSDRITLFSPIPRHGHGKDGRAEGDGEAGRDALPACEPLNPSGFISTSTNPSCRGFNTGRWC